LDHEGSLDCLTHGKGGRGVDVMFNRELGSGDNDLGSSQGETRICRAVAGRLRVVVNVP
jgi:hypothetical protein